MSSGRESGSGTRSPRSHLLIELAEAPIIFAASSLVSPAASRALRSSLPNFVMWKTCTPVHGFARVVVENGKRSRRGGSRVQVPRRHPLARTQAGGLFHL